MDTLNTISKTGYKEIPKVGTIIGWEIVPIRIQEWGKTQMMPSRKTVGTRVEEISKSLKPCYAFNITLLSPFHIYVKTKIF